jgi:hypothetical protein
LDLSRILVRPPHAFGTVPPDDGRTTCNTQRATCLGAHFSAPHGPHGRHVLYFLVLVAMAFLWAPSAQTALYAYLEEVTY